MKTFNINITVSQIPDDTYEEVLDDVLEYIESKGLKVDPGVGQEDAE